MGKGGDTFENKVCSDTSDMLHYADLK